MKKQAQQRQAWQAQGHGEYTEILGEKDFFAQAKASERVVCHLYRENWPCKVSRLCFTPICRVARCKVILQI